MLQIHSSPPVWMPLSHYSSLRSIRSSNGNAPPAPAYCQTTMKSCCAANWRFFPNGICNAAAQPRVFTHRDYMPRNLMVSAPNPGVLDFQDAVTGPLTYDLVSLFRD